ncbi:MAG: GxxExxY protein [Chloroflexota bacterium]|nr:GxxExxY protein [Chloroflexota bacterium]MDE2908325.1 GxxExxY protein [Chloroflexota bacterium]
MGTEREPVAAFEHDELTYRINGAAIAVHREIGAGLFEGVYENALCIEFERRGLHYERQKRFQAEYQGEPVGQMVADLVVENEIIVELKSVKELLPLHEAQLIAYLKAAKLKTGLLINFNVRLLKSGIKRISV